MNPEAKTAPIQEVEFVLRRMQENFDKAAVLVPVGFALLVVALITLFQREHKLRTLALGSAIVALFAIPYCIIFTTWLQPNAIAMLAPFVVVGLFYVGMMYYKDSQTIHPAWASFLGTLRTMVYAILAFVFLLPGCQTYDKSETHSRVLVLVDVSGSMGARDSQGAAGQDPAAMLTRQDEVIAQLVKAFPDNSTFVEQLVKKSPVVLYRFGGGLDREPVFFTPGKTWNKDQFTAFLKFDKKDIKIPDAVPADDQDKYRRDRQAMLERLENATDTYGSVLEAVQREGAGGNIQAVVVFSDGMRNKGGEDALRDLISRAGNPKKPIQIMTVGVGNFTPPVRIRVNPLVGPSDVRPDDGPFTIRVPVFGDGLAEQKFSVTLFAKKVRDRDGKVVQAAPIKVETKDGQFKGGGDHPFAEVEFVVDLEKITNIKHKDDEKGVLQGTWEFIAEIPRHARENIAKDKHVSDPPTPVRVLDKKLRVLLAASGPNRDYQFARTQLYREVLEKRLDLSIFLQTAIDGTDIDQDVEGQRLLTEFPSKLDEPVTPENKLQHFKEYDVIITFDVDWSRLRPDHTGNMKKWVGEHGGGFILFGGPIYTDRLARPAGAEASKLLGPLFDLLPVKLNDTVFQQIQAKKPPDRTRPWPLKFTGNAKGMDFLKLDEESDVPLAGWNEFFWNNKEPQWGKQPKRGFHSYHPVEQLKPTAEVLATFGDPDAPKIEGGKFEMPYLVSMRYDKGKTFYVGSGEMWRLRLYKEGYYERFLIKLLRYVSGGGLSKRIGTFSMGPEYVAGNIPVEARVLDKDGSPLKPELKPEVTITRPPGFDEKADKVTPAKTALTAKKTEQGKRWDGIFAGNFPAETPGVYTVKIEIPGAEPFSQQFLVMPPNLEMGNLKTNFDELRQMASDLAPLLSRLSENLKDKDEFIKRIEEKMGIPAGDPRTAKLFFTLKNADVIPELLTKVPPEVQSVKGRYEDLWDKGSKSGWEMQFHHVMMLTVGAIGVFAGLILLVIGRRVLAAFIVGGAALVALGFLLTDVIFRPDWLVMPLEMSWLLALVVGLLSVEWLTRKLLKLA